MGNRLSKLYTKTGDGGTTGLAGGRRVEKNHIRIEAIGTIDELNSCIGLVLTQPVNEEIAKLLHGIQHDLFDLGHELAVPGKIILNPDLPNLLEEKIDFYNANLEPLKEFILPGGNQATAFMHLARTVCRRSERVYVALSSAEKSLINPVSGQYLNRLSDLFFVLCRILNEKNNETLWEMDRLRSSSVQT